MRSNWKDEEQKWESGGKGRFTGPALWYKSVSDQVEALHGGGEIPVVFCSTGEEAFHLLFFLVMMSTIISSPPVQPLLTFNPFLSMCLRLFLARKLFTFSLTFCLIYWQLWLHVWFDALGAKTWDFDLHVFENFFSHLNAISNSRFGSQSWNSWFQHFWNAERLMQDLMFLKTWARNLEEIGSFFFKKLLVSKCTTHHGRDTCCYSAC